MASSYCQTGFSTAPHRLAVLTATVTVLLIFVGGLVTNTGSALAVPDWPTTFGYNMFLYPWSKMVGGIFYEHSHRLLGSAVGVLTIALAIAAWLGEPRRWVRILTLVAVGGVVVQGLLGGLRVVLLEQPLAIVHGCVAQAFLALMVVLAVVLSPRWHGLEPGALAHDGAARVWAVAAAASMYVQIALGALVTHTGTLAGVHILFAAAVTLLVGASSARILVAYGRRPELRRPALLLIVLLAAQLSLGLGAYVRRFTVVGATLAPGVSLALPTTHRLVGALMWAAAVVLAARVVRLTTAPQPAPITTERTVLSVPRHREVVA